MSEPKATLDDLYNQNNSIIGHLERLNENLYLIREAVYGQTVSESGLNYNSPKHGAYGMGGAESLESIESYLASIEKHLSKR